MMVMVKMMWMMVLMNDIDDASKEGSELTAADSKSVLKTRT